jgi:hypothetical protein
MRRGEDEKAQMRALVEGGVWANMGEWREKRLLGRSSGTPPNKQIPHGCTGLSHAPGKIRTCDLSLRRRALYPLSYGRKDVGEAIIPHPAA